MEGLGFKQTPPKTSHYGLNGTGRDTYIYKNNGGLYPMIKNNNQPPVGKYRSSFYKAPL
jgi:hypothetical protein